MTTNVVVAVVTAYCKCNLCCGPNAKGICANNKPPIAGVTIAASRNIPLGSKVEVLGKTYTVQDRLAKRFDNRFDIYFASHKDAKQFGIRTNKVTIITK
jgi:3D (Asp-Asp-Asp) domain-containing protein